MANFLKPDKDGLNSTGLSSSSTKIAILEFSSVSTALKVGRVVHVVLICFVAGYSNAESLQSSWLSPSSHKISLFHPFCIPNVLEMGEVLQIKVITHSVRNNRETFESEWLSLGPHPLIIMSIYIARILNMDCNVEVNVLRFMLILSFLVFLGFWFRFCILIYKRGLTWRILDGWEPWFPWSELDNKFNTLHLQRPSREYRITLRLFSSGFDKLKILQMKKPKRFLNLRVC